jgi:RNA-directed DNA polymerase
MNDIKDRKLHRCTSGQKVWVKPEGFGERVDSFIAVQNTESPMFKDNLMETICERENLWRALRKVKSNKGCAGIDGMNVNGVHPVSLRFCTV